MDLELRNQSFGAEDLSWLGSAHGTQAQDTITLDGAAFGAVFTDGVVKSGTVLARNTTTGLYAPYTPGGADGTDTAVGFLATTQRLNSGDPTTYNNVGAALLWHGEVVEANLPVTSGPGALDGTARTALAAHFRLV